MTKSNQCSLEIADHLSRCEYDWCPEAETRLREQHDRIKVLEVNHKIQLNINEKALQYIVELEKANVDAVNVSQECVDKTQNNRHDPVNPYQSITDTKIEPTVVSYTHPVKELTDEEIMSVRTHPMTNIEFARAILLKAQEK